MWSEQYIHQPSKSANRARRAAANPYVEKSNEFPGRLFCLLDSDDSAQLKKTIQLSRETYVELGSGSGGHLLEQAQRNPRADYFGFEIRFKRAVRTIEKALAAKVENVFVLRTVSERLEEFFSAGQVQGIYVNFPDPWEKPKRHKHRVMGPALLDVADRLLAPNGFLSIKTDHAEYFEYFSGVATGDGRFTVKEQSRDLYASEYLTANVQTEFEKLFCSKNQPIHYLKIAKRVSAESSDRKSVAE